MENEKELVGAKVVGFYKNNSTELVGKNKRFSAIVDAIQRK